MHFMYLLSIWIHILAAAVWLGGMFFLTLALIPVMRRPEFQEMAASLTHRLGLRFRTIGWLALGMLIISGFFNLAYRGLLWQSRLWQPPFGHILATKLGLVIIILILSALHDFVIGPRATALMQQNPLPPQARRLLLQARWIGRVNLILALIVIALGVMMVRGVPW